MNFDVIIIGGGITGSGCARDCSLRGLKVLLLERADLADGATGRNHGLLHSGARYAVTDKESAEECIRENMLLRKIATHCIEETDGLFISLPEDGLEYQKKFINSCREAGIRAERLSPKEALKLEPSANPELIGAVRVPDGAIDPFRLCISNITDAKLHGASIRTYTEVTSLIKEGDKVTGVRIYDKRSGNSEEVHAPIVVNAAGVWGGEIAKMAGANITMFPAKGSLLIFGHRVNRLVINRCRKPANGDILVPGDDICLIGTTSSRVPIEECDHMRVTPEEVRILLEEGSKLCPSLISTRILRAYAGVRPLVAADNDPSGRNISRGYVLMDHELRDGIKGFITISGGKMMTYRLMAEKTVDLICAKLGNTERCKTAEIPLPGSEQKTGIYRGLSFSRNAATNRHGTRARNIKLDDKYSGSLVCECEGVGSGEIEYAIDHLGAKSLIDIRRRTRAGMGTCQGAMCACRTAGVLASKMSEASTGGENRGMAGDTNGNASGTSTANGGMAGTSAANGETRICPRSADRAERDLAAFMAERYKGMYPVAWGDTLRECQYIQAVYRGICGIDETVNVKEYEI